ncbi:MBL fold metallo-hydrolase [Leptospira biflexa]|uniref:MBL fold metallo-hydrolase n=1 Tax=Leptospira biflexa TaxID=172 RepID=UPI0010844755|nr:MBL fold metallo-hydrolase [Leptospira biflexa]TGM36723.1 MBL fold metallo-hydrolase [Leptospira biflexa]TGM39707.1 MBL fold metallo-hydrolase [Leptospira biflexa]
MMEVLPIFTNSPLRNYTYLIYSNRTGEVYCVDPYNAPLLLDLMKKMGLKLKGILNTHEHGDHTEGNLELKEATNCLVYGHTKAENTIPGLDTTLKEGDICFSTEGESIEVWDTPGHTFSHLSFVHKNPNTILGIFSGDTLFNVGVGNCFRGGDPNTLYETIKNRYATLPDSCLLYPGHDYWENNLAFSNHVEPNHDFRDRFQKTRTEHFQSTLGLERQLSPFFRLGSGGIKERLTELGESFTDDRSIFLRLRKLRDRW